MDMRPLKKLVKDLEKTAKRAFPYAMREYVNSAAFLARDEFIKQAEKNLVLRSQWTKRSIQVDKVRGLNVAKQVAVMGSVADYMATQEDGAIIGKKGRIGTPIPAAAPGKRRTRGRVVGRNKLSNITVTGKALTGIRQRRNAAAISIAARHGGGVVFLDLRSRSGLYRISGTKRGIRIKKVWDLSKKAVRVPRNPMLQQALAVVTPQLPELGKKALLFQLRRHKVLGY